MESSLHRDNHWVQSPQCCKWVAIVTQPQSSLGWIQVRGVRVATAAGCHGSRTRPGHTPLPQAIGVCWSGWASHRAKRHGNNGVCIEISLLV